MAPAQHADASPTDAAVARRTRERRSQHAMAGWLASRMRAGAQERRQAARRQPAYDAAARATYDSLGAFVGEDPRRELRSERELGGFWLGDGDPPPAWRAAWLPRTGELYLQRIGGVVNGGRVTVVARVADESALDERLAGWEDVAGTRGSVTWLLERLGIDARDLGA